MMDRPMKSRCPECGYIANSIPPTHKCPECGSFSHDWLIYDWVSFASIKRRHLGYNGAIICLALAGMLTALSVGSSPVLPWMLALLIIPAMVSGWRCRRQLRDPSKYQGHKAGIVFPWFSGFGGL